MKIVINTDYGGFGLSDQAFEKYLELKGIEYTKTAEESTFLGLSYYDKEGKYLCQYNIPREDPELVQIVETLGETANNWCSQLKVVEVPDDVKFYIHEYDGIECVHEVHRTWN